MNKWHPANERPLVVLGAQLLDCDVERSRRFRGVGGRAVGVALEKVTIELVRDFRTVIVVNRPVGAGELTELDKDGRR